jgi:predicted nuclease of predicted toxin-antitoxin system
MKFLVDAQLPRRLVRQFQQAGIEAIHTLDLPLGNRTPDTTINELSVNEHYIVVTKDLDFIDSFHLHKKPWKLLLIATGNIKNADLEALFLANIAKIVDGFKTVDFIELNRTTIIFHL